MAKNNAMIKTTTLAAVAATMLGTAFAAGVAQTAVAAVTTSNDITLSAAKTAGSSQAPSFTGRTLKAYKIAGYKDVQIDTSGNVTGYDLSPASAEVHTAIVNALKTATQTNGAVKTNWANLINADGTGKGDAANLSAEEFVARYFYGTGTDAYTNVQADGTHKDTPATSTEIRTFANALEKSDALKKETGIHGDIVNNGASATFNVTDGQEGIYIILDTTDFTKPGTTDNKPDDNNHAQTISRAMIVGTAFKSGDKLYDTLKSDHQGNVTMGELKLKADTVTIDKEVVGNDHLIQIGSTRTFQIDTNVPNYQNNYQYWNDGIKYSVTDNPSDNLEVTNFKVQYSKDDGKNYIDIHKNTDYTVADNGKDDPNDFTVSLKDPAHYSGQKIRITYDATVTGIADTTENDVSVNFSNDPKDSSKTGTASDTEKLYETELNLNKVKFNDENTKLDGATFKVTTDDKDVTFSTNKDKDVYNVVKTATNPQTSTTNTSYEITLNSNALQRPTIIKGLAADTDSPTTYHFKETKAPTGYVLGEHQVEFDVIVTPVFDKTTGELKNVQYQVNGDNYKNFLDLGDLKGDGVSKDASLMANTTRYASGVLDIENTTNINDFAKTGGQILSYVAIAAAAAVLGAGFIGVAKVRRNRAA